MKRLLCGSTLVLLGVLNVAPLGQMRVVPLDDEQGHVALGLVLRRLGNAGVLMMATAHPDDENNGLLVMLNRGQGYRTALATATRGNGGQNEIGPEILEALGVLRTEELAALHRFDGAEQYFTRAVDFGYSFSIEETFEKWGRDEIIGDFVRLIRMIRPDVIVAMRPDGFAGGQHHQASAVLSREAFRLAGDASKYPEQIREGLRAWQPKKFYFIARFGFPGEPPPPGNAKLVNIDLSTYDPLLGKTYSEIGTEARSMHKCQGMAQLLALPGPASTSYQLVESAIPGQMDRDEKTLFDGIDNSLRGVATLAGTKAPKELLDGLAAISAAVNDAQRKFDGETDDATLQPLVSGLHVVRMLRETLGRLDLDGSARYDIDLRLAGKEKDFQQAILLANGLRVEALANDGVVVPGQSVRLSVIVANHGKDVVVKQAKLLGFDGDPGCTLRMSGGGGGRGRGASQAPTGPVVSTLHNGNVVRCDADATIPPTARIDEPYWHRQGEAGRYTFDSDAPFGQPFRPTPFLAEVTLTLGGEDITSLMPVQYRYEGNIFSGEKRSELQVVPAFSVRVSPETAIVPASAVHVAASPSRPKARSANSSEREIRVTVVNDSPGAADSIVKLQLPPGWTSAPTEQTVRLERQDQSLTVRFEVKPSPTAGAGVYHVNAVVSSNGRTFDRGYEVVEYPHIRRRHIYDPADVLLKVIDVKTLPNLTVGYIMGVGDQVPPAVEQLGAKLETIGADDLAWGNLSRFDAILTGVRAYERREDLRANNSRLLEYVHNGGTLIVQYNKFEFNEAQYGPYPAKVSSNRVTEENSPVTVLTRQDPLMTFPNQIGDDAWKGWVQERGLYFLGEKDPRYHDLLQLEDPFPYNKGPKLGSLVETTYGRGHWIYVGLGLWRQLPAGTDGAYQILANLISRGKAPVAKPTTNTAGR